MIQLQNSVADTIVDLKRLEQIEEDERGEMVELDNKYLTKKEDMKQFFHLLEKLAVLDELEVVY